MRAFSQALRAFLVFSVLAGLVYPLAITGLSHLFFPWQAKGSLIVDRGRVVGSALIGQKFTEAGYFHGRPSAIDYDASNSGGTNFGPASAKLLQEVAKRVEATRKENGLGPEAAMPADLVLASASGLDPDISMEAALLQVPRVARARALSEETLKDLIGTMAQGQFPFTQARVNVLRLNLAVARLTEEKKL